PGQPANDCTPSNHLEAGTARTRAPPCLEGRITRNCLGSAHDLQLGHPLIKGLMRDQWMISIGRARSCSGHRWNTDLTRKSYLVLASRFPRYADSATPRFMSVRKGT